MWLADGRTLLRAENRARLTTRGNELLGCLRGLTRFTLRLRLVAARRQAIASRRRSAERSVTRLILSVVCKLITMDLP